MKQKITDYLKDGEEHWVAKLECGHVQHVRHDPPWTIKEWVTTAEGREAHIGETLNCVLCEEMGLKVAQAVLKEAEAGFKRGYQEAALSGLCLEGQLDLALDQMKTLDLAKVVETTLA
jgi:hypothetical protein